MRADARSTGYFRQPIEYESSPGYLHPNMLRRSLTPMDTNTRPMRRFIQLLVPVFVAAALIGCGDAENAEQVAADTLASDTTVAAADTARTIQDILEEESRFSQFETAVDSAGLAQTLSGPGPFTVFAPTNEAFQGMQDVNLLLSPEQRDRLRGLILYHVNSGERPAQDLQAGASIRSLEGSDLTIAGSGDSLQVGGADIIEENIRAGNGIIHVIDEVLDPTASDEGV